MVAAAADHRHRRPQQPGHDQGEGRGQGRHRGDRPRRVRRAAGDADVPADEWFGQVLHDEDGDQGCRGTGDGPDPVTQEPDGEHDDHAGDECRQRAEHHQVVCPPGAGVGREGLITPHVEPVGPGSVDEGVAGQGGQTQQRRPDHHLGRGPDWQRRPGAPGACSLVIAARPWAKVTAPWPRLLRGWGQSPAQRIEVDGERWGRRGQGPVSRSPVPYNRWSMDADPRPGRALTRAPAPVGP